MSLLYTPAQIAIARESYDFWRTKTDHLHACALLGNEGGETGFKWALIDGVMRTAAGDHGEAKGVFQWHEARAAAILAHTKIDVRDGTHLDMLCGAYAEMTEPWSPYRHVWPLFESTVTLWAAVSDLVVHEEQSASQASDIVKRTGIAAYFDHVFASASVLRLSDYQDGTRDRV